MPMEVGMCAWWEKAALKVKLLCNMTILPCLAGTLESRSLAMDRKGGGRVHLKLDSGLGPKANKYHEGTVKRTLKRKLNVHEIAANNAYDVLSCFTRLECIDTCMHCYFVASSSVFCTLCLVRFLGHVAFPISAAHYLWPGLVVLHFMLSLLLGCAHASDPLSCWTRVLGNCACKISYDPS